MGGGGGAMCRGQSGRGNVVRARVGGASVG